MSKQARSQLTQRRMLTSAAPVFAQHGYHAASLKSVADVRLDAALRLVPDKAQLAPELPWFLEAIRRHGAVWNLAVAMPVDASHTAPSTDRRDLSARVRAMWDALPHTGADEVAGD
jgi:AcrR family transcriptional regulator